MTAFDVINSPVVSPIDQAAAYAALTEDAINARQAMDTGRWILGECTRMLLDTSLYGQHTLDEFGDTIGVDPKRLYEYGSMASYYTPEKRESLSELNLTYSHLREARRLKDIDKSVAFLQKVALNAWTIAETRDALKEHFHPDSLPSYSDSPPMTDSNGHPYNPQPEYQWRGPAVVHLDANGVLRLQCEGVPEVEQGKRYMVSFEEY
jgi:hypothetical protein